MRALTFFSGSMMGFAIALAMLDVACGGGLSDDSASDIGSDGGSDATKLQDSGSPLKDSGSTIDAAPKPVCPAQWDVYGNTDPSSDLGHVDPRLIASGECHGANEELADASFPSTDFALTFTESAPASGMFVAHVVQTTPFPIDRTLCLQSSGPNTGAAGYPDDGGLICLTDVTEDQIPWDPNFTMFTNMEDADGGVFIDFDQNMEAGANTAVTNGWCRFVKN
ncbi:MAG: hypothetical protein ACRELY_26950 [Polyangiaceae bacterium]